jgi:amidophosphoribosyltransferase
MIAILQTNNIQEEHMGRAGLVAAIGITDAAEKIRCLLYHLEHRGKEFAGIVSVEEKTTEVVLHKLHHLGPVDGMCIDGMCVDENSGKWLPFLEKLPGKTAIGCTGDFFQAVTNPISKIEPFVATTSKFGGTLALTYNGSLAKADSFRDEFIRSSMRSVVEKNDLELLAYLITRSQTTELEDALTEALSQITLAYSLIVLTPHKLIAVRDRFGVRPLSLGKMDEGYIICSENSFEQLFANCRYIRDIAPGEMLIFDLNSKDFSSRQYAMPAEAFCAYELIFFADPRSRVNKFYNEDFRQLIGTKLFQEHPDLLADFIMPNPDAGKHPAIGISKVQNSMLYKEYFLRRHTYQPLRKPLSQLTEEELRTHFDRKLHLRKEKVRDKKNLFVDAIMRNGTTAKILNGRLRQAGAAQIFNGIAAPPITNTCPLGMGFTDRTRLAAANMSIAELQQKIDSDKLAFLSLEGLQQVVDETYKCGICTGCFGGKYAGNFIPDPEQLKFL